MDRFRDGLKKGLILFTKSRQFSQYETHQHSKAPCCSCKACSTLAGIFGNEDSDLRAHIQDGSPGNYSTACFELNVSKCRF
ncbi:hypothetical protein NDU88_001822 [Pleurodeles waltl]|uniref:Uncharacterized protein n=1 Tax=Pleurodeles waltl TaxID=8319 RepID=A0AAV7W1K9_PLEWA|nr:hypothetical protein NDU88_001822 [Pleurodeles waltl]